MKNLDDLKDNYNNINVPPELESMVMNTIKEYKKENKKSKYIKRAGLSIAASFGIFIASINVSPTLSYALETVPVLGKVVSVLTFREFNLDKDTYNASIKAPVIEGLDDTELQNTLNEKYLNESKELYENFKEEMDSLEESGGGHLGVSSGYEIKTDTGSILSIGRYYVNTVGSSSTTFKYDTIDKKRNLLLTLPGLFKDDSYIDLISENIKAQMKDQMSKDSNAAYWIDPSPTDTFEKITDKTNFYINSENKLVISFDKYEVAPGVMGIVEFVIPTETIQDILVSNEYIK